MRIITKKVDEVVALNRVDTSVQGIDPNQLAKMVRVLTRLYQEPFIWFQELLSNSVDAHTEVGQEKPVMVDMTNVSGNYVVTFSDFGPGLDEERIKKCYTFLYTTKDESNRQMGGWGLGSKSPFAYVDDFIVETLVDNVYYSYIIKKEDTGIQILKLEERPQVGPNQTHVKIEVKREHKDRFFQYARDKAIFFKNVIFSGELEFLNNTSFVEFKNFYLTNDRYDPGIFAVVGQVSYPIKRNYIDRNYKIGLKLKVGEIDLPPTRESLEYTDRTIKALENALERAEEEYRTWVESQPLEVTSLTTLMSGLHSEKKQITINNQTYFLDFARPLANPDFENLKFGLVSNLQHFSLKSNGRKSIGFNSKVEFDSLIVLPAKTVLNQRLIHYLYNEKGIKHIIKPKQNTRKYYPHEEVQLQQLITWFKGQEVNVVVPKDYMKFKSERVVRDTEKLHIQGSWTGWYTIDELLGFTKRHIYVMPKDHKMCAEAEFYKNHIYVAASKLDKFRDIPQFKMYDSELTVQQLARIHYRKSSYSLNTNSLSYFKNIRKSKTIHYSLKDTRYTDKFYYLRGPSQKMIRKYDRLNSLKRGVLEELEKFPDLRKEYIKRIVYK